MKFLATSTLALAMATAVSADAVAVDESHRELGRGRKGGSGGARAISRGGTTRGGFGTNGRGSPTLRGGSGGKWKIGKKEFINRDSNFKRGGFFKLLEQTPQEGRQQCANRKTQKKAAQKNRKGKAPKKVNKPKRKGRKPTVAPKSNLEIVGGKCVEDHICAEVRGDPHFKTFGGMSYDCQGQGEFVLVKSKSTAFEIQGRFGPPENGSTKAVTITKAISIDTGVEGAPQVDLFAKQEGDVCIIDWYVNGELVEDGFGDDGLKYPGLEFFDNVNVNDKEVFDYAYFTESGLMYSVYAKKGGFGCVLNSKICLPPSMMGDDIYGLMGTPDTDPDNEWMDAFGRGVPMGAAKGQEPYQYCTTNHCVTDAEDSIFGYEPGTSHADFAKCGEGYTGEDEKLIEQATDDCKDCCDSLKEQVDAYESCLLECMEGGEEACVAEIINEEVLAVASSKCPDSRKPNQPKKAPPKKTKVCKATGNRRGAKYRVAEVEGVVKFNQKGGVMDVLPGTEVEFGGVKFITTDNCGLEKVAESEDTPSLDTPSEEEPEPEESSSEEEPVPICRFLNSRGGNPTYRLQMGSPVLRGRNALPGEHVRVRGGKMAVLNEKCKLEPIEEPEPEPSVSEEEPSVEDPAPVPSPSDEGPSVDDRTGGPGPGCKKDTDCPQPRCQEGFPCFTFTCVDGECEATPESPDEPSPDDKTTEKAFSKGDPHFKTFGGELYDFHGECDLVLLHNPDFKEGLGMDIHIRTKIENFWSSIESAAMKLGEDTMEIRADPSSPEWLWFNGKDATSELVDGEWYKHEMAGYLVRYKQTGENTREANLYLKGAKEVLVMKTFKSFVRIDVNWKGSDNYFNSVGLLGSHANEGKRLGRDGKFIEDVNAFGQEWQVIPEVDGSLFHSYEGAVVGKKCVMPPHYEPGMNVSSLAEERRRLGESTLDTAVAEKACNHLSDPEEIKACVFDVIATQDLNMASTW